MDPEIGKQIRSVSVLGELDLDSSETELCFADGRIVRLPTSLLQNGQATIPFQGSDLSEDSILIPLVEEQLEVSKRLVETGTVRLHKTVEAFDVTADEPLTLNAWRVERVAMHQVVEEVPPTRQDGLTTIYPVVEERLVLTKELVLVEELRVTRDVSERHDAKTVTLRRERLNVERSLPDHDSDFEMTPVL